MVSNLHSRLSAAAAGPNAHFFVTIEKAITEFGEVEVYNALGLLHGDSLNLCERIADVSLVEAKDARRLLLPAISRIIDFCKHDGEILLACVAQTSPVHLHEFSEQLQSQFERNPALPLQLVDRLAASSNLGSEGPIRVWASAFVASHPMDATRYLVSVAGLSEQSTVVAASLMLSLERPSAEVLEILMHDEAKVAAGFIVRTRHAPHDWANWRALCLCAEFSDSATRAIAKIPNEGPLEAKLALMEWLQLAKSPLVGKSQVPIIDLLSPLMASDLADESLRKSLDILLAMLVRRPNCASIAADAIAQLGLVNEDLTTDFPNAITCLATSPTEASRVFTFWLTSADAAYRSINYFLRMCTSRELDLTIDSSTFNSVPVAGKMRVVRRLLGLTLNGPLLCKFISVFAECPTLQPDGLSIAREMLAAVVLEYPVAADEFLCEKTVAKDETSIFSRMYKDVYANVLEWRRVLDKLPDAPELSATSTEQFNLTQLRRTTNREIVREAHKKSIFAQIAQQVHVSQGHRVAQHSSFGLSDITEMTESSYYIELPTSELADPVGGAMHRLHLIGDAE